MEYVDFYTKNLLKYADAPEGKIILNNIAAIDYDAAVAYAETITIEDKKDELLLSEKVFVSDISLQKYLDKINVEKVDESSHKPLGKLNAKNLWELCVPLYAMIVARPILFVSLTKADEYLKLFNEVDKGIELTSIEFKGVVGGKTKNITLQNKELMQEVAKLFISLHNTTVTDKNLSNYDNNRWTTLGKLADKRCIDYTFAKELEEFLESYLGHKVTANGKLLILQILYLFGRFKNNPPSNTDIYRKLMSDEEKLELNLPSLVENKTPLPFTTIADSEILRIRQTYNRFTADGCEKSK
nr:hypothetical protein [uncultured Bacteroides sp.]